MMKILTSVSNPYVSEARKLQQKKFRNDSGLYLAEGLRLCEEAVKNQEIVSCFYHESLPSTPRGEELLKKVSYTGCRLFQVTGKVLEAIAETETPQGIVLVLKQKYETFDTFKFRKPARGRHSDLMVAFDGLQDPGNLGTCLRTLWCAGGDGAIILPGCADPFGGKAVRASMGGIFNIPLIQSSWEDSLKWAKEKGFTIVAADIHEAISMKEYSWPDKVMLVIGSEARGLISANKGIDQKVMIPMAENAESLNASVAAGILIYEAVK